jgi:hypothetical protein
LERIFLVELRTGKYAAWKKAREVAKNVAAIPLAPTWTQFIDFYIEEHILANKLRFDHTLKFKVSGFGNDGRIGRSRRSRSRTCSSI